ncbi:DoxX family membrane protein [Nocardia sp. JMUB6875]|uniref:hypothetical protein n=1 Tax=Nocardia sp. JMUB6875 TaxID=3158170 RepID=UPI0032E53F19
MTVHANQSPRTAALTDPGYQAFLALRLGFGVLPILFGLDKFAHVLTNDWTRYLSDFANDLIPGDAHAAMNLVGIIEIIAGIAVLVYPRLGAPLVAAWLAGIIINLLAVGGYADIALRDFGLMAAALVLTRLAWAYPTALPHRP